MRKKTTFFILSLAAISLLMSACKEKRNNLNDNNRVLHRGIQGNPRTLDPNLSIGTWEADVDKDLFLGLMTDAADGSAILGAAKSWKVSDDGRVYTFQLRQDGKWSDGMPVTAHDFVFSFQRTLNPETAARYAGILYAIKNARAVNSGKLKDLNKIGALALDDYTLQITLETPAPFFLNLLSHQTAFPVPKHLVQKIGNDWAKVGNMVSNGAFTLAEWQSHSHIKVVKNKYFYDVDNVKIDEVYYYPLEDRTEALKKFLAEEIDYNPDFPLDQYQWLKENMPNEAIVSPHLGLQYYSINYRLPKLRDKNIRKALSLAVNREVIAEKILANGEIPAYSFVPPLSDYRSAQLNFKGNKMDERLAEAKQILADAGYSKENPLKIQIRYNTGDSDKQVAVAVGAMWKELGIVTELVNTEVAMHYNELRLGHFEVGRARWIADYPDAQNFLMLLEYPGEFNYGEFANKEYNSLVQQATKTVDRQKRALLLQKAEQVLLDDYAVIPIFYYVSRNLVSFRLKGWMSNSTNFHLSRWLSK